ncbi:hypothetical protein L4X63_16650 [Geomonas sp. Red32]|uniref:hypothetical protein n=1 Tax=Geomonas sp. Red32 TaxID=2912856 RepID=UPI00202CC3B4|nr:hypothetical protein [Geomonas sp. Red32]MCM0083216.1 hypothetical protein [Geomonas sp. Red32]
MSSLKYLPYLALLLLSITLFNGCTLFGKSWSSAPTATLLQVQDDYRAAEEQAAATEWALHDLYFAPDHDIPQAYKVFCGEAANMEVKGKNLVTHAEGIHYRGEGYLVEPEVNSAKCPLPGAAPAVQTRPARLGNFYNVIDGQAWDIRDNWRAYQFDIRQICEALDRNFNPALIDALTPIFGKAAVDNASLIESLEQARHGIKLAGSQPPED